jgi:transposase
MMLLAAEKGLTAPAIAAIGRDDEQTVRRWMKRYMAEGIEGLKEAPKSGHPGKVTAAYEEKLVAAATPPPGFTLLDVDAATLGRLYGRGSGHSGGCGDGALTACQA